MCPNAILHSNPGKTVVIDSNCLTTNVAVPRLITWEEIEFPENWVLNQAVEPTPQTSGESSVDQIIQDTDGNVMINFTSNRVSRLTLSRSSSSRSFQRNNPCNISLVSSRHSVSEERPNTTDESVVRGIRLSDQEIPHGIYVDPFDQ
jgi:hypothetical protein